MKKKKVLLTTRDVASATNLSPQTVLNYVEKGVIKPAEKSFDGRFYFSEEVVIKLSCSAIARKYKNHKIIIGICKNEEEEKAFEEKIMPEIYKAGQIRIDDMVEYMQNVKECIRAEPKYQRAFLLYICAEITRTCEIKTQELEKTFQQRILSNNAFEDMAFVVENREKLLPESREVIDQMGEQDKKIFLRELKWYHDQYCSIRERYSIDEIKKLLKGINNSQDLAERFTFIPKTSTVRCIWEKGEQKFYTEYVNKYVKQKVGQGYVSLRTVSVQDEKGIYKLLSACADDTGVKIQIYGSRNATREMSQVIQFLQEYKNAVFVEEV